MTDFIILPGLPHGNGTQLDGEQARISLQNVQGRRGMQTHSTLLKKNLRIIKKHKRIPPNCQMWWE